MSWNNIQEPLFIGNSDIIGDAEFCENWGGATGEELLAASSCLLWDMLEILA